MKRPTESIQALLQKAEKDEMSVIHYLRQIEEDRDSLLVTIQQICDRFNLVLDLDKIIHNEE